MKNNELILNPDKTKFNLIGDDGTRNSLNVPLPVSLLVNTMEATESVKNLRVTPYADNSMQGHVANLYHVCYYYLWTLWTVCWYLTHRKTVKVANAMVSSHLDYCNSLLYHTKRQILIDLKEFKTPCVTLCANLVNSAMWHLSYTNYTGSPFSTVYDLNTTWLPARP